MGWERDLPDFRDLTPETPPIRDVAVKSRALKSVKKKNASSVDLRPWCSPVENQEDLGSCTANAGVALLEYYQRRAFGKHLDGSRLFLYKVTRNLLGWMGDRGAYLRTTMKAMVLFGIPPEHYWPYVVEDFDREPDSFLYAFAQGYKTLKYFRHDHPGLGPKEILASVKEYLFAGFPCMFGFSVFSSIPQVGAGTGDIPYPQDSDEFLGGHAVVAVGYKDSKMIGKHKGALLIRNSWGADWGEQGYGWLPYEFVKKGLAVDFWSLMDAGFINTDLFK
jgi:C1A family cysteine protease